MKLFEAPLDSFLYKDLTSTLYSSGFWLHDNEDRFGREALTESAELLKKTLQKFFKKHGLNIKVVAESLSEEDHGVEMQSDEKPNRYLIGAEARMSTRSKGQVYLKIVMAEEGFDPELINAKKVVEDVAIKVRHELIHLRQYDSLARDKGITKYQAKKQYEKWNDIPEETAPITDYLKSRIEIDAFGHEFAERLAQEFGLPAAQQMVARKGDVSELARLADEIDLGYNFPQYFKDHPGSEFTERLRKKIKKYLRRFGEQGIYENARRAEIKSAKRQLRKIIREIIRSGR